MMVEDDAKRRRPPLLADCHTHLDTFPEEAVPGLLSRAAQAGVNLIVTAGLSLSSSRRAIELAAANPLLYAAVGMHPLYLAEEVGDKEFEALGALASAPKVVALSEIGLDFEEGRAPRAVQLATFRRLVSLGVSRSLPIIFHDRGAHDDIFSILRQEGAGRVGLVMHYFTGDLATARRCLDLGGYISLGKPITKPEYAPLRDVVRALPIERILLETDAYWRPARAASGQTEPSQVATVAAQLAAVKGVGVDDVASITTGNLRRLLGIHLSDNV